MNNKDLLYPELHENDFPQPPAEPYPINLLVDSLHTMVMDGASRSIIAEEIARNEYFLDSRDENNFTLLHHAAREEYPQLAQTLLDLGANKHTVDGNGYTPAAIAEAKGNAELMEIFADPAPMQAPAFVDDQPIYVEPEVYHPPRELSPVEQELIIAGINVLGHLLIGAIKITYTSICNAMTYSFNKGAVQEEDALLIQTEENSMDAFFQQFSAANKGKLAKMNCPEIEIIIRAKGSDGMKYKGVFKHNAFQLDEDSYIGVAHEYHALGAVLVNELHLDPEF